VKITIEPKPKLTVTPTTTSVCEDDPLGFELTTTTNPSAGDIEFVIVGNPVADPMISGASGDGMIFGDGDLLNDVLSNDDVVSHTVTYTLQPRTTDASLGCSGDAVQVIATVHPRPVVTPASLAENICSGSTINIAMVYDVSNTIGIW